MRYKSIIPVVAIFSDRSRAEMAIDDLWHEGFQKDQIGLAAPGEDLQKATTATGPIEETAATGAVAGAATGAALGALAGALVVAPLPGIGPILAGGLLTGIVGGAATGAALGTFAGPFVAMGLSKEDTFRYESAFRAGRSIVVVRTPDRQEEAYMILRSHGPVEIDFAGHPVATVS